MMSRTIRILDCKECNYTWPSTGDELPKACPKCKSLYWENGKTYGYGNTCYDAGKLSESLSTYCTTNSTNAITYQQLRGLISTCKTDSMTSVNTAMSATSGTLTDANMLGNTTGVVRRKKEEKKND
jgi:phage FluMu protein Com